jgi:hypothetical protein
MAMLHVDRRLGYEAITLGKPRDHGMRIPDRVLNCVCFLYGYGVTEGPQQLSPLGTGFFMGVRGELNPTAVHTYLATARHIVRQEKEGKFEELHVRYNSRTGGGNQPIPITAEWMYHHDPSADVAVIPFERYVEHRSDRPLPMDEKVILGADRREQFKIGIGDELSVVGLFTSRPGLGRNIPIVRSGLIAAMPQERIIEPDVLPYEAYLAELRSIRGLSGSPVFVNLGLNRNADGTVNEGGSIPLLGIVRSHWEPKIGMPLTEYGREMISMNTGIATITPVSYLADILYGETARAQRRDADLAGQEETLGD